MRDTEGEVGGSMARDGDLSSTGSFPGVPRGRRSGDSLMAGALPVLLLRGGVLYSVTSEAFPPLFLFFDLEVVVSTLGGVRGSRTGTILLCLYFPSIGSFLKYVFRELSGQVGSWCGDGGQS